jgi:hypothetical protein
MQHILRNINIHLHFITASPPMLSQVAKEHEMLFFSWFICKLKSSKTNVISLILLASRKKVGKRVFKITVFHKLAQDKMIEN